MNPIDLWAAPQFSDALALSVFVKASLILGGAWGAAFLLRHTSAAVRHSLWSLALAGLLLLPVLTAQLPAWHVALPPALQSQWDAWTQPVPLPVALPQKPTPAPWQSRSQVDLDLQAKAVDIPVAPASPPSLRTARLMTLPWRTGLLWIWRLGVLVLLARFGYDALRIRTLGRHARALPTDTHLQVAQLAQHRMGVRRRVRYLQSKRVTMAMTWGCFRPTVLLPASAMAWPLARLEVVLLHELAHIKRWDYAVHVLAHAARALNWMNPLVWVAVQRLHAEQERASDDRVLNAGAGACDYALHLVNIARTYFRHPHPMRGGMALARRSTLSERVEALVNPRAQRHTLTLASSLWTSAGGLLLVLPIAALQLGAWTSPDTSATRLLIEQLESPDPMVWQQAAWAEAAAAEAPARMIPRLLNHENGLVRAHTAWTLGEHTLSEAVAPLIDALEDANANVRLQALLALEKIGDDRALPAMSLLIADACPDVRLATIGVLKNLCRCKALEVLPTALADADVRVRRSAAEGLGEVIQRIQTRPSVNTNQALKVHLPQAVTALIYALNDEDEAVRAGAVVALGEAGQERAYTALKAALRDHTSNVRLEAARALGKLGFPCAAPVLRLALRDACPDVRAMAAWALDQLDPSVAV